MTASFKQVLVHLDPSVAAAQRLALARDLAGRQGAALGALYATTPVLLGLPFSPEMGAAMVQSLIEIDDERRARTRKMFDETLRTPGVAASWSTTGEPQPVAAFAQQALYADLVVVGQRDPADVQGAGVPADFPESVMLASGRPALVVPYIGGSARIGQTVAIAWKETREAARAVTAALPILQQAGQVHIIAWEQDDEEARAVQGARLDLAA